MLCFAALASDDKRDTNQDERGDIIPAAAAAANGLRRSALWLPAEKVSIQIRSANQNFKR